MTEPQTLMMTSSRSSETTDTDNDGLGNNADYDDDGDGWNDTQELDCNLTHYRPVACH